jgi:NADH-quinone oxidoreductase subunit L
MLKSIWLVPALPLAGFVVNLFFGKRLGRYAGWLASTLMVVSFGLALAVLGDLVRLPADGRLFVKHLYDWIAVGSFHVAIDLRVDPLSMTMALVVTGVGAVIHVYSIGYMHGDPRYGRFFSYLNLFCFFMLTLVLAQNFLLLYVGWEGVGLCSYLLIGFWHERPAAASAAKKAFVVTRIGDTFMFIGVALVFLRLGSLDFSHVLVSGPTPNPGFGLPVAHPSGVYTVISLLLLAGAIGKSAQVPLHVWLPDAMEGPTPVSALIHAATMVTAGVYLVARTDDFKRVLAWSTISQLGFMFTALGLRAYSTAIFLLVTHAFYKALMFLSAGSVMHTLDGETDMKRMGGLGRSMPITAAACSIGALALAGVPPFAGFFSKDDVLAVANQTGHVLAWAVALVAAFLSALYISRMTFLAFFGDDRTKRHAHESPPVMTIPMGLLAVGATFGGFLGAHEVTGKIQTFLGPVLGPMTEPVRGLPGPALAAISIAISLVAVLTAAFVYASGKIDWLALRLRLLPLRRVLERGWYVEDVYSAVLVTPGKAGAAFLAYVFDGRIVDGAVNGVGRLFRWGASVGRHVQTGFVRNYALAFLLGALALLVYVGFRL